jgi:hypothetical protein
MGLLIAQTGSICKEECAIQGSEHDDHDDVERKEEKMTAAMKPCTFSSSCASARAKRTSEGPKSQYCFLPNLGLRWVRTAVRPLNSLLQARAYGPKGF